MLLGYSRVSSDEQAAHGISIEAQRDILRGYAAMAQSEIKIFEDAGFSGKNTQRPALQQLLSAVRAGSCSAVVVWKLDRLSRSLRDTLAMIEDVFAPNGVTLVSVTESIDTSTPSGRMMLNLLASFAQLEREQDSDRVVMSHKHLARDCKYLGGHIPLGYAIDEDRRYQLDPVSAPIVRHVFDLYMARSGYASILDYLNAPDRLAALRRSRPYTKQHIHYLLSNEIYSGTYVRRMGADPRHKITSPEVIRIPGGVPALLSPEEWQRVCSIRTANATANLAASYRARTVYPLTGLVFCSVCGKNMKIRHGGKTRAGEIERYYSCPGRCVRSARLESVQQAVLTSLAFLASDDELIRGACAIANTFMDDAEKNQHLTLGPLQDRLAEIRRQSARLVNFIKTSDTPPPSVAEELRSLTKEEHLLRARLESAARSSARYDPARLKSLLRDAANIKELPPEEQKARIQAAVQKVLVSDSTYKILFVCPTSCGDEPTHYVEHTIKR